MCKDSSSDRDRTDRTAATFSTVVRNNVVDYSGTAEPVLPVSEVSAVQLRSGPAPTNLEIFSSERVSVLGMRHHAATVGVVILNPAYFSFMWWDGREDCRINGEIARSTVIYAQGEQDGFHAAGGARRTMGIAVRRNDLVETLAALRGVGPEDVLLTRGGLELSPDAMLRFRSEIDVILRNATGQRAEGSWGGSAVDPSEAIFGLLVDAYLRASPDRRRRDRPHRPEHIVRKAEETFFASRQAKTSLADLCAATGVSQSALYRAFSAVCGEPPLAYFHKRRLTDARRRLINAPAHRGAIKHAALSVGLTELGRFSVEYRRLFGESPSATLNRHSSPLTSRERCPTRSRRQDLHIDESCRR